MKKNNKYTSFISEHTAEYILIYNLFSQLKKCYRKILPVHFSSTREGSNISINCMKNEKIRVIGIFARRPKITVPMQAQIQTKFNSQLFEFSARANKLQIPFFAGVPLSSSILELSLTTKCKWFQFINGEEYPFDITMNILINEDNIKIKDNYLENSFIKIIDTYEIYNIIQSETKIESISKVIENLRYLRKMQYNGYGFYIHGYNPFYLLLFE